MDRVAIWAVVESKPGKGSTFTVCIPKGMVHLQPERIRGAEVEIGGGERPLGIGHLIEHVAHESFLLCQ